MQCNIQNVKTPPPSPLGGSADQKLQKLNVRPLVATDFSEADQKRFWARIKKGGPDDCWEWQGALSTKGYGLLFESAHRGRTYQAHRVMMVLSGTPLLGKLFVLHSCDNPPCCNPAHLRVGTPKDNAQDASSRGRLGLRSDGEKHGRHRLTDQQILEIRKSRESRKDLALKYGVSYGHICKIIKGHRWDHLPLK